MVYSVISKEMQSGLGSPSNFEKPIYEMHNWQ